MPAFTFEKIPPPPRAAASSDSKLMKPKAAPKPRSIVSQMIDRLTMTRLKRQQIKGQTIRKAG